MLTHPLDQHRFHALPGDVAGVQHAALRVTALAAEVIAGCAVRARIEPYAQRFQLGDARRAAGHDLAHDLLAAEPRPGDQRVGHVLLKAVAGLHDAGDTALRAVGVAVVESLLGHQQHAPAARQIERAHQPGNAAAHHEVIT